MTIEQKMQVEVIKGNKYYYCDFEGYTLITDGHFGVYIPSKELKLNKDSMNKIYNGDSLNPDNLLKECYLAKETKVACILNSIYSRKKEYAIKIKAKENDKSCFIDNKYLKLFKNYDHIYIKDEKSIVLITRYGLPYGIVLPVYINEDAYKEL